MARRSLLYRRLGIDRPLVSATVGDVDLGDHVESVRTTRGGRSLDRHTPATASIRTPTNLGTSGSSRPVTVDLDEATATDLAARTYTTPAAIRRRFTGRLATQEAPDRSNRRGGRRGTDLVAAAWSSLYAHAPDTWTPWNGATLSAAAAALLAPSWEPNATPAWDLAGSSGDTWPTANHDPITAADLLGILTGRLYLLHDRRDGALRVRSLERIEALSAAAGADVWPLARAHCLAPTRWVQPSSYPTQYRLTHTTPTGTAVVITGETPDGTTRVQDLDWTDLVSRTEQWRRVYGLRFDTFTWPWRLPSLTVRLDHLIASPHEGHRRAAGMLLGLEVSDPVPLAGDWPTALAGVHIVTGIEEELTPHAWTLRLSLAPYGSLAGLDSPPVAPRTWAQARTRTWDAAGARTWIQGVAP